MKNDERLGKKYAEQAAMFMCMLVITLPFISSAGYAATGALSNVQITNNDGLRDVLKQGQDAIHVKFDAEMYDLEQTPVEVKKENINLLFHDQQVNPDKCTLGKDSIYSCEYTSPQAAYDTSVLPVLLTLLDKNFELLDQIKQDVVVDTKAPTGTVVVQGKITLEDTFDLLVKLQDTSCDLAACKNKCSGVKSYEIYVGETGNNGANNQNDLELVLSKEVQATDETGQDQAGQGQSGGSQSGQNGVDQGSVQLCAYETIITTSVKELGLTTGDKRFCVKAKDAFGNQMSSPSCGTSIVDYQAPSIIAESFQLIDPTTNTQITHKLSVATKVDIKLNLTDDVSAISADLITADFSDFNSNFASSYSAKKPNTCEALSQEKSDYVIYTCTWKGIEIKGSTAKDVYEIKITAKDLSGNKAEQKLTVTLPTDIEGPKATKLENFYDGFLNPDNNTFMLTIQEDGVGLFKKRVYISVGGKEFQADDCFRDSTTWKCMFNELSFAEGTNSNYYLVQLNAEKSKDDLGNTFTGSKLSRQMLFDSEAPKMSGAVIVPLGSGRSVLLGTGEDVAIITANITELGRGELADVSGVKAENVFAGLSAFDFTGVLTAANTCEENLDYFAKQSEENAANKEHLFVCTWEYSGPITEENVEVSFLATDNAGNFIPLEEQKKSQGIQVVQLQETKRDIWVDDFKGKFPTATGVTSDYKLNRNFLWMSQQGSPFTGSIVLEAKGGSTGYVHEILPTACKATLGLATSDEGFVDAAVLALNHVLIDNSKGNAQLNILITIPKFDKDILKDKEEATVVCEGTIVQGASRTSNLFTPNEPFKVTFTVKLEDTLFTKPDNAALDKLSEKDEHIQNLKTTVEIFQWLSKWIGGLCNVVSQIRSFFNNVCIVYNGFAHAFGSYYPALLGQDQECKLQADWFNKLWYGHEGSPKFEGPAMFKTNYDLASIGFVCDAFMCTQCDRAWKEMMKGDTAESKLRAEQGFTYGFGAIKGFGQLGKTNKGVDPRDFTGDSSITNYDLLPEINFDPQQNIIIGTLCAPPCLPTIQKFLQTLVVIFETENTCRLQAFAAGEDASLCEDYSSYLMCEHLVGSIVPFYMIADALRNIMINLPVAFVEKYLIHDLWCKGNVVTTNGMCAGVRVEAAIASVSAGVDAVNNIAKLIEQFKEWGIGGDDDKKTPEPEKPDESDKPDSEIEGILGPNPTG